MPLTLTLSMLCEVSLNATVIGTLGSGPVGYNLSFGFTGQTFTVPMTDNTLTTWQFNAAAYVDGRGFRDTITFAIYDWPGLSGVLTPHYASSIPWPTTSGVVTLAGLSVPLSPGQTYIATYQTTGYSDRTIGFRSTSLYPDGQATFSQSLAGLESDAPQWTHIDTDFAATFINEQVAADVPEPSCLPILVVVAIVGALRRKK